MIENIEFKDTSTVIIHEYPKEYTFDEVNKNINYLFKIASKAYDSNFICFVDNLNDTSNKLKISFPILNKSYSMYKREDLTILKPSKCLSAEFNSNNSKELSIALDNLYKIIYNKNLKIINLRLIYSKEKIEIQIIIDKN